MPLPYPVALVVPLILLFKVVSIALADLGDASAIFYGPGMGIANVPTSLPSFLSVEARLP